jgi:cytochrome P450
VTAPAIAAGGPPPLPPGPNLSALAVTLQFKRDPIGLLDRCRDAHGSRFTLPLMPHGHCVVLGDPDDARCLFAAAPYDAHAGYANAFFAPAVGPRSILLLDGDEHLATRRLLLPAFHGDHVRAQVDRIERIAAAAIAAWPADEPLSILPLMQRLTMDVLTAVVLGVEGGPRAQAVSAAMLGLVAWANPPGGRVVREHGEARTRADAVVLREIELRRAAVTGPGDVIGMLLAARDADGAPLNDEQIRSQLVTVLLAGYETSATTLSWAVERLARHPEVLARLTAEAGTSGARYADAVVRETLRLRPVLPMVGRRLRAPLALADGAVLGADITVAPSIWLINTRAAAYPEPLEFRPERFLATSPDTFGWLPFGGGVRRCLGAAFTQVEMRIILRSLVRRFAPVALDAAPERMVVHALTLVPEHGARVRLRPRRP